MKFGSGAIIAMLAVASCVPAAVAQSGAAAVQYLDLSAFAAATGVNSGLGDGRSAGITGGVDLGIRRFSWFRPSIEGRGSYSIYDGDTASMKSLLGGLKFEKPYGRYHPYVDALLGRGEIHYANGGYPNPAMTFRYLQSPAHVYDFGGGVDINCTYHLAFKADAQYERYSAPVVASGHLTGENVSVGVVYRFNFTHINVP